jgi:hypothetical protein
VPELPASVRLALWVTHEWSAGPADGFELERVLEQALPDVDHVDGDVDRLDLWQQLGESALLVALPAPGDITELPTAPANAIGAATAAGECVYVPGIGGMLVPSMSLFGPGSAAMAGADAPGRSLDVGTRLDWTAYDSSPVPRHRVEALDCSQLEASLRRVVSESTLELECLGGRPFAHRAGRELAEAAAGGRWGLPPGIPARSDRVIRLAANLSAVASVGVATPDDALSASASARRQEVLRRLLRTSEQTLAGACNAACAAMAGWLPVR